MYLPRENQNCYHLIFCIKNVSFVLSCPCYISKVKTQSRLPRKQSLRTRPVRDGVGSIDPGNRNKGWGANRSKSQIERVKY